jgi:hypothetical protein
MSTGGVIVSDITVKTQKEWDDIPSDFGGIVYINSARETIIIVRERKGWRVEARGNSSVVAWGNSSVVAWENSSVEAWGNSSVEAWGNSSVVAWENSSVVAWENSSVVAWENSSVVAWENSSVEARGNSSVEGQGNAQICQCSDAAKIQAVGNSRIVWLPRSVEEYCGFYGIKVLDGNAVLYKATIKKGSKYHSSHDNQFTYEIGETKEHNCDPRTDRDCSFGLHVAHMPWCIDFGRGWDGLAIIECLVPLDCIVLPTNTGGKVRTSKLTVSREVPCEEWGVYGKIYAKRRAA